MIDDPKKQSPTNDTTNQNTQQTPSYQHLRPSSAEGMFTLPIEAAPTEAIKPEATAEIEKSPETPQPAMPTTKAEPDEQQSEPEIAPEKPPEHVVDLRRDHKQTHELKNTADETTMWADEEEEGFIREVMEHHADHQPK
jgi:hypothetical protein